MKGEEPVERQVAQIMTDFARFTGLSPEEGTPTRYLWTDAFGVCNFLGLFEKTKDPQYRDLALGLVEQTHRVLGRHRNDDRRTGWISGLTDEEGAGHPTSGGLRIGKKLRERRPGEPFDERLEWDRDGQYFHYLTKWMHALDRMTSVTGDFKYNRWALELARVACAKFVHEAPRGGSKRMAWKMSIDLSHPLVPHMGQHDPLEGLVAFSEIDATGLADSDKPGDLRPEIAVMEEMCRGKGWVTDDPLGLGSLLSDAYGVAQLMTRGYFLSNDLLFSLLDIASQGLQAFAGQGALNDAPDYRLPFRELGLAIGLEAAERLAIFVTQNPGVFEKAPGIKQGIEAVQKHTPLAKTIEQFWLDPEHRKVETWTEHRNINMVMLATCLSPDGYLKLF
jgi:hypothetical protein